MTSLGVLLSGRGSNFVAIADSIDAGRIPEARIAVVSAVRSEICGPRVEPLMHARDYWRGRSFTLLNLPSGCLNSARTLAR